MPQRKIDVNTRKIYWNIRRELKNKPKTKEVLDAIKLVGFNNFNGFIKIQMIIAFVMVHNFVKLVMKINLNIN